MAIALYMDVHVPKPITVGLRIRQVDVLTAQEDDRRRTDDTILLDRAAELGRVMVSFDADMLRIATTRQREGQEFGGIVYGHQMRVSVGECVRDLEFLAKAGELKDFANDVVYLPL
jgi:hypothetical protein